MSLYSISTNERWKLLEKTNPESTKAKHELFDYVAQERDNNKVYAKNIENFIGTVKVPVGIAGPFRVKGTQCDKLYYVPLATTEAALLASVSRGAKSLTMSGGITAKTVKEGVARAPAFEFNNLDSAHKFYIWVQTQEDKFKEITLTTSRYCQLTAITTYIQNSRVDVKFEYTTGNASGQNMSTFATQKIFEHILTIHKPEGLTFAVLEGALSSDKKASANVLQNGRGRRVICDAIIPATVVKTIYRTTPQEIARMHRVWAHSPVGMMGFLSGNAANVLAAIYIACGQDPACVAEGHIGTSCFEETESGDLHCTITMQALMVGTAGGGTSLPSQSACLSIVGAQNATELAEVIASVCLAGDLSLIASFCSHEFAKAHFTLARTSKL